jgi:hypothetical protein
MFPGDEKIIKMKNYRNKMPLKAEAKGIYTALRVTA